MIFRTWDKKRCERGAEEPGAFPAAVRKRIFVEQEGAVLALNPQLHEAVRLPGFSGR